MREAVAAYLAVTVFILVALYGCGPRQEPCYGLVGVNPVARTAILFDSCRGEVFYQNLPPMSADKAPGA